MQGKKDEGRAELQPRLMVKEELSPSHLSHRDGEKLTLPSTSLFGRKTSSPPLQDIVDLNDFIWP